MADSTEPAEPTIVGRLAIASVMTAFSMAGVPEVLDAASSHMYPYRQSALVALLFLTAMGALASMVIRERLALSGMVLTVATFIGVVGGLLTRPSPLWSPPASNALWVGGATFLAACLGTLFGDEARPASVVLGVFALVVAFWALA